MGGVRAAGDASNELSVSGYSRAPATLEAGQINVALLALTVAVSGGAAALDRVTVLRTGTAADADVAPDGVRLWWDANGNVFIDGADRQLDSSEFTGGAVSLRAQQSVWAFQPIQLLISVTPAENATPGATLGLTIDGPAWITATAGTTIAGEYPITSTPATIVARPAIVAGVEASGSVDGTTPLTITGSESAITATVAAGATAVPLTITLVRLDPAGLPSLPGSDAGAVHRLEWRRRRRGRPIRRGSPHPCGSA